MSLDEQRARVCVAGVVLLFASLALTGFGVTVPAAAWTAFVTMAVGPLVTGSARRYREEAAKEEER